jgi:hypothetical protein
MSRLHASQEGDCCTQPVFQSEEHSPPALTIYQVEQLLQPGAFATHVWSDQCLNMNNRGRIPRVSILLTITHRPWCGSDSNCLY